MTGYKVNGTRGRNGHLTEREKHALKADLTARMHTNDAAVKYGCSSRIVLKYRAIWFGPGRNAYFDTPLRRKPKGSAYHREEYLAPVQHKNVPEPHVSAGITKAMLMGGNARVARRREVSDVV